MSAPSTYRVRVHFLGSVEVEVQASTGEVAVAKACELVKRTRTVPYLRGTVLTRRDT